MAASETKRFPVIGLVGGIGAGKTALVRALSDEDAAERYAWRVMERLYDRETVLAALGLFWMFTGEE